MPTIVTNSPLLPAARLDGGALVVSIAGEIDLSNTPELRNALFSLIAGHNPQKVVLNLSQVPYMDSSALAVLVETMRKVGKGGKVCLTGLQPRVKGLLEIARLHSIFTITATDGRLPPSTSQRAPPFVVTYTPKSFAA